MQMSIHPALKGRNKTLVNTLVVPFQGVAFHHPIQFPGDALGWNVTAPSGRDAINATPKLALQACEPGRCRLGPKVMSSGPALY
jgi:hypothetical protein